MPGAGPTVGEAPKDLVVGAKDQVARLRKVPFGGGRQYLVGRVGGLIEKGAYVVVSSRGAENSGHEQPGYGREHGLPSSVRAITASVCSRIVSARERAALDEKWGALGEPVRRNSRLAACGGLSAQNKKYRCAIGSTFAGSQVSSSPSAQ